MHTHSRPYPNPPTPHLPRGPENSEGANGNKQVEPGSLFLSIILLCRNWGSVETWLIPAQDEPQSEEKPKDDVDRTGWRSQFEEAHAGQVRGN